MINPFQQGLMMGINDAEQRAIAAGWNQVIETVEDIERKLFWKHPTGTTWTQGAVIVMHGGGGSYTNFAIDQYVITAAEYEFCILALAQGFSVFILDSSFNITDANGYWIGKIWDEEKLVRPNVDIPFLEYVIDTLMPSVRPVSSRPEIFLAGHSSGGFMAVRAMSNFGYTIRGAALISSGDPYGTYRDGTNRGTRQLVGGDHKDIDTDNELSVENGSGVYPATTTGELVWDTPPGDVKPPFRVYHSILDGINDMSAAERIIALAYLANGYPKGAPSFLIDDGGERSVLQHLWVGAYSQPILNWFKRGISDYWDYSNRTPPSIAGLDEYYEANGWTWDTVASADPGVTGPNVMRLSGGSVSGFQALGNPMYRVDGTVDDAEVVCRFKARSAAIPGPRGPVGLMIQGDRNGYTLDFPTSTSMAIRRRDAGSGTGFSVPATAVIATLVTDTWYCVRFRRETDGTFKAKFWAGTLASEPAPWDITTAAAADMTYTFGTSCLTGGLVGTDYDFDVTGYAISGTAPIVDPGTSGEDIDEGDTIPVPSFSDVAFQFTGGDHLADPVDTGPDALTLTPLGTIPPQTTSQQLLFGLNTITYRGSNPSYQRIPAISYGSQFTLEGFFRTVSNGTGNKHLIGTLPQGWPLEGYYRLQGDAGGGHLRLTTTTGYLDSETITPESWYFFSVVYDGTEWRYYIGEQSAGIAELVGTITETLPVRPDNYTYMGGDRGGNDPFGGWYGEIRLTRGFALRTGSMFVIPTTALTTS